MLLKNGEMVATVWDQVVCDVGGDGVGGERSVVVDVVQRGRAAAVSRRPRLALTTQSSLLPSRLHVHHVLRVPHLRRLRNAASKHSSQAGLIMVTRTDVGLC